MRSLGSCGARGAGRPRRNELVFYPGAAQARYARGQARSFTFAVRMPVRTQALPRRRSGNVDRCTGYGTEAATVAVPRPLPPARTGRDRQSNRRSSKIFLPNCPDPIRTNNNNNNFITHSFLAIRSFYRAFAKQIQKMRFKSCME